jgi:type I restriction enzyme S subunit
MKVEKGYKKTELGEIPEDWHFKTFGEVMKGFSSGQTPSRSVKKFYTGKIPWITSGELNYNVITDTIEKITPEAATKTHLKTIPVGTFLMAITGLEAEGTRGSCAITGVEATTNQSCMALYPNEKELTTEYLFQFYKMYGNQLAFKYCQGTKQQSYTGKIAKTLPIIIPPTIDEQKAITKALNETDAFVSDLEKLILKKQNIKQGTMQVLLTGKRRLKGFSGEWTTSKLDSVAVIRKGEQINKSLLSNDDVFAVINGGIEPSGYTSKWNRSENTITISEGGNSCGFVNFITKKFWAGGHCYTFHNISNEVDNLFLFQLLKFKEKSIMELRVGSGLPNIQKKRLNEFSILLPPLNEQQAISKIMIDIFSEIETLQQHLAKIKLMKEGMMQNLLTGKVRLT